MRKIGILDQTEIIQQLQKDVERLKVENTELRALAHICFVIAGNHRQLNKTQMLRHASVFPEWTPGEYSLGDTVRHNGVLWLCLKESSTIEPSYEGNEWFDIGEEEQFPNWEKPICNMDGYNKGERVKHEGKLWRSNIAYNITEPSQDNPDWDKVWF